MKLVFWAVPKKNWGEPQRVKTLEPSAIAEGRWDVPAFTVPEWRGIGGDEIPSEAGALAACESLIAGKHGTANLRCGKRHWIITVEE